MAEPGNLRLSRTQFEIFSPEVQYLGGNAALPAREAFAQQPTRHVERLVPQIAARRVELFRVGIGMSAPDIAKAPAIVVAGFKAW